MSDLDELKTLLFGAEKEVLDSIQQRVQRPEARAADIAAVLPEAIRLRHRENDDLIDSLREPVGRCMRDSIKESPDEFADVLYPVMGPAIRKSIAQALRTFSEQINRTLEHSLTLKGLKWRIQAARAGIPFSSYVIQQSLLYRVEQAYLISRENGLLIGHVHHDASHIKDSDAVSAMFTAIQDFVKESFSPDRTGRLETADMGDFTLWAVHGPHALLVCVIRGVPPRGLRNDLSRILEQVHFRFGDGLRDYAGDTSSVGGIEEELQRCLSFEAARPMAAQEKKKNWPAIIIVTLLAALLAYGAWIAWQRSLEMRRLESVLANTPGYYVADVQREDDVYVLHGLRDPLAQALTVVAERAELPPDRLRGNLSAYRSLDEPIVFQRIANELQAEDGMSVALVDGAVRISGTASKRWIDATRQKLNAGDWDMPVVLDDIAIKEWPGLESRAAQLDGTSFYFTEGTELAPESAARLASFTAAAAQLAGDVATVGGRLAVRITGFTDGTGSSNLNDRLSRDRAGVVSAMLRQAGLVASQITLTPQAQASTVAANEAMRRATVDITLAPPEL